MNQLKNNMMKYKIYIFLTLCLFCKPVSAQWVVADPANLAQGIVNTTRQIVESNNIVGNTLRGFEETVKIYNQTKDYYDALKSVNNLIKDGRKVQKTALLLGEISEIYITSYRKMLSDENFAPQELDAIGHGYNEILLESADLFSDLQAVVNPSSLSLNDRDRMENIDRVYNAMNEQRAFCEYYSRKFMGVSYVRSAKKGDTERVKQLYGTSGSRYR